MDIRISGQIFYETAKAVVLSVAQMAHDRKVVGLNPVTGILDGSGVKATQV